MFTYSNINCIIILGDIVDKKKILLVFIIAIISLIILDKIFIINIEYKTDTTPTSSYIVEINRLTKNLKLHENNFCVDKNCSDELIRKSIKLSKEEYRYIKLILKQDYNKSLFMNAISALVKDQNIMFSLGENGYEESDDINKDGIVTYREFANNYLSILSK